MGLHIKLLWQERQVSISTTLHRFKEENKSQLFLMFPNKFCYGQVSEKVRKLETNTFVALFIVKGLL